MAKTPKKRNRAAQDATLVNVRAMRKEIGSLKERLRLIARRVAVLEGK